MLGTDRVGAGAGRGVGVGHQQHQLAPRHEVEAAHERAGRDGARESGDPCDIGSGEGHADHVGVGVEGALDRREQRPTGAVGTTEVAEHERLARRRAGRSEVVGSAAEGEVEVEVLALARQTAGGLGEVVDLDVEGDRVAGRRAGEPRLDDVELRDVRLGRGRHSQGTGGVTRGVGEAGVGRAAVGVRHCRRSPGQQGHRRHHVDQAVAGVEGGRRRGGRVAGVGLVRRGITKPVGGVDEELLDDGRGQLDAGEVGGLVQQRDVARDVRRGHRRTGDGVVVGVREVQAGGADRQVDPAGRGDVRARCGQVGVGRHRATGAARGRGVERVVARAAPGVVVVGHREDTRGRVGGVGVGDRLGAVAAVVARGPHDGDAGVDQRTLDDDLRGAGVERAAAGGAPGVVDRHDRRAGLGEGRQHLRGARVVVVLEDPVHPERAAVDAERGTGAHRQDVRRRSSATQLTAGAVGDHLAGGDAGDVGAVPADRRTVCVVDGGGVDGALVELTGPLWREDVDRVGAGDLHVALDPGLALLVEEHRVSAVSAGVHDCHGVAGAVQLVAQAVGVDVERSLLDLAGAGRLVRGVGVRRHLLVGPVDPGRGGPP